MKELRPPKKILLFRLFLEAARSQNPIVIHQEHCGSDDAVLRVSLHESDLSFSPFRTRNIIVILSDDIFTCGSFQTPVQGIAQSPVRLISDDPYPWITLIPRSDSILSLSIRTIIADDDFEITK
jgi:hypothetical protein